MIKSLRVPADKAALQFLKELIYSDDTVRQCVIIPTARALRELAYEPFKMADLYTIKSFTTFTTVSSKPNIPQELRSFYLKKAAMQLSNIERATLFTKNDSVFLDNYISFQNIASSLLAFYRELNAEMIDERFLYENKLLLYTDYEAQVKTLLILWKNYLNIIDKLGYSDVWDSYRAAQFNPKFIDRYERYIFLIGGYLTKYELEQLKKLATIKDVTLIFNFVGKKDNQHKQYEKYLDIEIEDDVPTIINRDNCKIFETDSILAQVDMITFAAGYYHKKHKIDYKKMAVIIPNDDIKSYFLRLDRFNLFDVTANEDISRAEFFSVIQIVTDILSELTLNGKVQLDKILTFFYSPIIIKNFDTADAVKNIKEKIRNAKIYLSLAEFKTLPFFDDLTDILDTDNNRYKISTLIRKIEQIFSLLQNKISDNELQAYDQFHLTLERLKIIYKDIDEEFNIGDGFAILLNDLSKIKLQTSKGSITVSGVLESRMLNYDLLFILELNEGTFPPKSRKELFLNTQMRLELDLPTFIDRENLLKNYLYQIISKSKIAILSYSKLDDREARSRIIDELIVNYNLNIERYSDDNLRIFNTEKFYKKTEDKSTLIKDETIITKLNNFAFSATNINTYINCGKKFYYDYILRPHQNDDVILSLTPDIIGSAFHKALKNIKDKNISPDDKNYADEVKKYFTTFLADYDIYNDSRIEQFVANYCLAIIPDFIQHEKERAKQGFQTLYTEEFIEVEYDGTKLRGYIDRVDKLGKEYDVIDYKFREPHKIEPLVKKIATDNFEEYDDLQLPFYALLLEESKDIRPTNLYQVTLKSYVEYCRVFDMQFYDKYKEFLRGVLRDIKDINKPFTLAAKTKICDYCDFSSICGRW